MTLSAALDSGLAFALVIVFFGFIYPGWVENFHWWGTEVYKQVRVGSLRLPHSVISIADSLAFRAVTGRLVLTGL